METKKRIGFFHEFVATNKCKLTIELHEDIPSIGLLHEEIQAVRKTDDTVGSLLQHLSNKIIKLLQERDKSIKSETQSSKEDSESDSVKEIGIPIELINSNSKKPISANTNLRSILKNKIVLKIYQNQYQILINAPLVTKLELPEVLYSSCTIQPVRFHSLYTNKKLSTFSWYISKDKEQWLLVGNSFKYTIRENDIDHYIKIVCVPRNTRCFGRAFETVSENKVEISGNLPHCPFLERHKFTTNALSDNSLRFVSYNVLSCRYALTNEYFPYCSPKSLSIDYRKQLITQELLGYNADIICLQEVDALVFISYYNDIFKDAGYMNFYHKKGNRIPEGLCCIFKKNRFKKIDDHQVVYAEQIRKKGFEHLSVCLNSDKQVKDLFLKQMASLQVTVLKLKDTSHFLIVGNTHLFYHPDAEHIRLLQASIATTYLSNLRQKYLSNPGTNVTVIFCGDFNSIPSGCVVEYMTKGYVNANSNVWSKIKKSHLNHSFCFESACGFPKYTNYTNDFKDCLDYIFIEKNKIKVNSIVPLPSEEDLSKYKGLPNDVYPSDHLAIVADLHLH